MIESISNKVDMLDSIDPRAGKIRAYQFVKDENEGISSNTLTTESCENKELTGTFDKEPSGFTGM